jgi:hypothetical protein
LQSSPSHPHSQTRQPFVVGLFKSLDQVRSSVTTSTRTVATRLFPPHQQSTLHPQPLSSTPPLQEE